MKKVIFALLIFSSCSRSEALTDLSSGNEISFVASSAVTNKGAATDNATIQAVGAGFGIDAYFTGSNDFPAAPAEGSFVFMKDQQIVYNSPLWNYSPKKYWPNSEIDRISFFAYAPYSATVLSNGGITVNYATPTVWQSYDFDLSNVSVGQMVDFVAAQQLNVRKQAENVHFVLKHITSRVRLSVALDANIDNASHVNLRSAKINASSGGVVKSGTFLTDNNGGSWQSVVDGGDLAESTFTLSTTTPSWGGYITAGVELTAEPASISAYGESLFLIPGLFSNANNVSVTLVYDIVTVDPKVGGHTLTTTTATVALPEKNLEIGRAYNYLLTIGMSEINVSASVEDWIEDITVPIPKATAVTANSLAINTAIDSLNTIKANATTQNWNYFTCIIDQIAIVDIDLSAGTTSLNSSILAFSNKFYPGDIVALDFKTGPVTNIILTPPTGFGFVGTPNLTMPMTANTAVKIEMMKLSQYTVPWTSSAANTAALIQNYKASNPQIMHYAIAAMPAGESFNLSAVSSFGTTDQLSIVLPALNNNFIAVKNYQSANYSSSGGNNIITTTGRDAVLANTLTVANGSAVSSVLQSAIGGEIVYAIGKLSTAVNVWTNAGNSITSPGVVTLNNSYLQFIYNNGIADSPATVMLTPAIGAKVNNGIAGIGVLLDDTSGKVVTISK